MVSISEKKKTVIEKADSPGTYEGLRDLWHRVFGDPPEFVDALYDTLGEDITGFVIRDGERVVSALSLYRCGNLYVPEGYGEDEDEEDEAFAEYAALAEADGLPVYVSYAICTDPEYRGQGLAATLTEYARELVTSETGLGGISLVSPAEPSLIDFYGALGYREGFFVSESIGFPEMLEYDEGFDDDYDEDFADYYDEDAGGSPEAESMIWGLGADGLPGIIDDEDGYDAFEPELSVVPVDAGMYNRYREAFLADTVHVSLSSRMLDLVKMCSMNGAGLFVINGGDAIAAVNSTDDPQSAAGIKADELLVNPMLMEFSSEIEVEIAARMALYFGLERLVYRTPGYGISQSMYASPGEADITGYFGFPLE